MGMTEKQRKNLSLFLAFVGYSIFGFSFIFSKQALAVASPFVLLAMRFLVAFLILNLLLLSKNFKLNLKGKQIGLLLLLGILQPVLYFTLENYGIIFSATSFAGTMLALVPIVSFIFSRLFLKENISVFQIFCAVLSIFGVYFATMGQMLVGFSWLGFVLMLAAVVAISFFNVLSRKTSADYSAFERTYIMFGVGAIVFVVLALIQSAGHFHQAVLVPLTYFPFWRAVIYLAILSSVGSFLMINYAMTNLSVAKTSIFANVTTVICIFAGVIFLNESFGIYQIIGAIIILAAAYGVNAKV